MHSLCGLKVVLTRDHAYPVVTYRFPKTRVKTKSLRKAYQRFRREHPVVVEYVRSGLEGSYQIGDTLYVDEKTWAALCREVTERTSEQMRKKLFELPPPAGYTNYATTAGVTTESLLKLMDEFKGRVPENPFRLSAVEMSVKFEDSFVDRGTYKFAPLLMPAY